MTNKSIKTAFERMWQYIVVALNGKADASVVPTKTSQLTNDSGFKTTDNNTTYSLSKSGTTITLTGSDGSATSVTDSDTNTTYSEAGSSLGLVKSGGDVTISSGVITVNDDSHNHTIANVDGLQAVLDGKLSTSTKYALSDSVGGAADSANKVNITRPANILTAASSMSSNTEQIFFLGSDGLSAGAPVNYCIINAKRGAGERTILDCYDLNTGDHYINGNMTVTNVDTWTGWILQPNQASIDTVLANANTYTDTSISNLINSAPTTLDTLGEIATAMQENADVVEALEEAIGTKANASDIPTKTSQLTNDSGFKTTDNDTTYTLTKSGSTITLTGSDGKTTSVSDSDTATTVENNLTSTSTTSALSAYQGKVLNDKISAINTNLEDLGAGDMLKSVYDTDGDGIVDNAEKVNGFTVGVDVPANAKFTDTVYTHPTTSGNKHIPSGGSSGQILRWSADGTAVWGADNNTTYGVVSTTADGLAPKRDGSTTKFLRGDGTWAVPPDTNTVYTHPSSHPASMITGLATVATSGSYDDLSNKPTIPTKTSQLTNDSGFKTTDTTYSQATSSALGLVKIGYTESGKNYPVELNSSGQMYVNVPWTDNNTVYTHPSYTAKSSGLYKVTVDGTGHVSATSAVAKSDITALGIPAQDTTYSNATTSKAGLMSPSDKIKLNGLTSPAPWSYVYDEEGEVLNLERSTSSYTKTIAPTPYKVEATVDLTDAPSAYGDSASTTYAQMATSTTAQTATIYIDTQLPSDASISSMSVSFKIGTSNISSTVWTTRTYAVTCGGNTLGSGSFTLKTAGNVTTVTVSDVSLITSPIIKIVVTAQTTTAQSVRIYGAQVDATYTSSKECVSLIRQTVQAVGEHAHSEYALTDHEHSDYAVKSDSVTVVGVDEDGTSHTFYLVQGEK